MNEGQTGGDAEDFIMPEGRSENYTIIEILMMSGRSTETKKRLIRLLFDRIEKEIGISPVDIEITIIEAPADRRPISARVCARAKPNLAKCRPAARSAFSGLTATAQRGDTRRKLTMVKIQRRAGSICCTRPTRAAWCERSRSRSTRRVLAGYVPKKFPPFQSRAGRIGRGQKLPPQLGHTPSSTCSTHAVQNVHSNEQIRASVDCAGRGFLQCSQLGRNSNMA